MKRDAHYYATLAFSRACGFKKESAQIIAYAAQFVDDAKINLIYTDQNLKIEQDNVNNQPAFFNMATCHSYFQINTFNYEAMTNNTCAFHFVPGCEGEKFTKRLRCKEESPVILDILNDVLREDDIIKLGIVLHAYVDTFSHQGFSGMLSKVNDIKNCKVETQLFLGLFERIHARFKHFKQEKFDKYFDRFVPAYGHVQALTFPDIPYLSWSYEYDYSDEFTGSLKKTDINNKERYERAFNQVIKVFNRYLESYPRHKDLKIKFNHFDALMEALLLERSDQSRIKNWKKVIIKLGLFNEKDQALLTYDENLWLKEAFRNFDSKIFNHREVRGAQCVDNFQDTCWYGFYRAVKWYKKKFYAYCSQYGLNIPN